MKKRYFLLLFAMVLFLTTACKQAPTIFKNRKSRLSSINIEKINDFQTNKNAKISTKQENKDLIKDTITRFLEFSYLDLDIVNDKQELLGLFSPNLRPHVESELNKITIGKQGEKLDSVNNADASISNLSIVWDKNNKPVLGIAEYKIDNLTYMSGSARITGQVMGSLVLTKHGEEYKIIDYRVTQKIKTIKEVNSN